LQKYFIERTTSSNYTPYFEFSKICYRDFLITNNALDDLIEHTDGLTFRQKYFPTNSLYNSQVGLLSNICGVGIFIITSDNKILIREASDFVTVGAGLYGFSASGTMNEVEPFAEVMRGCKAEINHEINLKNLHLFSFGMDTEKAYYQFSFYEKSQLSSSEIISESWRAEEFSAEFKGLFPIDFTYSTIVNSIQTKKWDGTSAASLMILCSKFFGTN